jgi:hypothetical protein
MEQREQDMAQRVALAPADADPAGQLPVQGKTALVREAEERGQQQAQQRQVRVRELLAEEQQQERQRLLERKLLERKLLEAPSLEAQPRSVQMWNQPELSWQPQLPQLSGPLSVHKPGVPTQENHLPTQTIGIPTLAPLLVGLQKVQVPLVAAQKTDRV